MAISPRTGMGVILRRPTRTTGFRGLRYTYEPPPPRMARVRRLGFGYYDRSLGYLGDAPVDTSYLLLPTDYSNLPLPPAIGTPVMPIGPVMATGADIISQMQQQAVIDQNPTDYVSPQSAIAAGLNPATVNAAWAAGLARYPTQQAAIAAGIAPTVITQYWAQSRSIAASPSTTSSLLTPTNLLIGGGLLFGLSLLMHGGKGRR